MEEVYVRRVVADVRGKICDLILFTRFIPSENGDLESGGLRVDATDGGDYFCTRPDSPLYASDLSQTLARRMATALEALTDKSNSSREFEYTLDADNVLHIRFQAGTTKNRLRVRLEPHPDAARLKVLALGALGSDIRRLRASVETLTEQKAALVSLVDWSKENMARVEGEAAAAAELQADGTAELLLDKIKEVRVAKGMSEEPEDDIDQDLPAEGEESAIEDASVELKQAFEALTVAAVRRAASPDRGDRVFIDDTAESPVNVSLSSDEEVKEGEEAAMVEG